MYCVFSECELLYFDLLHILLIRIYVICMYFSYDPKAYCYLHSVPESTNLEQHIKICYGEQSYYIKFIRTS
jgi:hypothetical protein